MPTIDELRVAISADVSGLQRGMQSATSSVEQFGTAAVSAGEEADAALATAGEAGVEAGTAIAMGMGQASHAMQSLGTAAMQVGAMLTATASAPALAAVKMGLSFDDLKARAIDTFTTMYRSASAARKLMAELSHFALSTPYQLRDLTTEAAKLAGLGVPIGDLMATLRAVGNAAAILPGNTRAHMDQITQALGQIKSLGMITGYTLRRLAMNGIPAAQLLAHAYHTTTQNIEKMIKKGKLTGDAFNILVAAIQSRFGGQMKKLSKTLSGAFSNVKDAADQAFGALFKPLYNALTKLLNEAIPILQQVQHAFEKMSPTTKDVIAIFVLLAAAVGPLLLAIGGLAVVAAAVVTAFTTLAPIVTAAAAALAPAAGPILAVIAAIVAATALLYEAWANDWGGIREKSKKVFHEVVADVKKFIYDLHIGWNGVRAGIEAVRQTFDDLRTGVGMALDALGSAFASSVGVIEDTWKSLGSTIHDGAKAMGGAISSITMPLQYFWPGVKTVTGWIVSRFEWLVHAISGMIGWIARSVGSVVSYLGRVTGFSAHFQQDLAQSLATDPYFAPHFTTGDGHGGKKGTPHAPHPPHPSLPSAGTSAGARNHAAHLAHLAHMHRLHILENWYNGIVAYWNNAIKQHAAQMKAFSVGNTADASSTRISEQVDAYMAGGGSGNNAVLTAALRTGRQALDGFVRAQMQASNGSSLAALNYRLQAGSLHALAQAAADGSARAKELVAQLRNAATGVDAQREANKWNVFADNVAASVNRAKTALLGLTDPQQAAWLKYVARYQSQMQRMNLADQVRALATLKKSWSDISTADAKVAQREGLATYLGRIRREMAQIETTTPLQHFASKFLQVSAGGQLVQPYNVNQLREMQQAQQRLAQMKQVQQTMQRLADGMKSIFQRSLGDLMTHGFTGFFRGIINGFEGMLQQMASAYLASQIRKLLMHMLPSGGSSGGSPIASAVGGVMGIIAGARAAGGPVMGGRSYLVGERGPEIYTPSGAGHITPNHAIAGGHTFNFNISTPDAGSFRHSFGQIMADAGRQSSYWARRNGG